MSEDDYYNGRNNWGTPNYGNADFLRGTYDRQRTESALAERNQSRSTSYSLMGDSHMRGGTGSGSFGALNYRPGTPIDWGAIFSGLTAVLKYTLIMLVLVPSLLGAITVWLGPRVTTRFSGITIGFADAFRAMVKGFAGYSAMSVLALIIVSTTFSTGRMLTRVVGAANSLATLFDHPLLIAIFVASQLVSLLICAAIFASTIGSAREVRRVTVADYLLGIVATLVGAGTVGLCFTAMLLMR